ALFPAVDLEVIVRASPGFGREQGSETQYLFAFDREQPGEIGGRAFLRFKIDASLLLMQLAGAANWNNIEIAALVECERVPDKHDPTLHSLMSFFIL
ncbi:MAG TPA: hypothetical protein VMQ73_14135, partial [Methylomirabilota bacterium]|nr:hypothetical protein [Methylomirabilota bacterium]